MADSRVRPIGAPEASCEATAPLWALSLDAAMRRRWAEGRAKYGQAWQGRHPLIEGHEELVDCLLYLGVAQGPYAVRLGIQALAERIARHIRNLDPAERDGWTGANLEKWRPRP